MRVARQRLFLAQFEKDLEFFKLFFLVMNKSRIIRHMGVLWARGGPVAALGLPSVIGTEHALETPCSRYVQCDPDVDPDFCRIVSDHGRHEAESCWRSDAAAERRCRQSGKTQVYTCHAGLVDIAVPVSFEGEYLGTLQCGQVLASAPSAAGFEKVRRNVARLPYIDLVQLEAAYWKVPVSPDAEIQNTVRLLEAFAEYLATSWGRLSELIREQNRSMREVQLLRKEFAHMALDGALTSDLIEKLELSEVPNRVLVVRPELAGAASEVRLTAVSQVVEEICEARKNTVAAYLRDRGISVFVFDRAGAAQRSEELAIRIIDGIRRACGVRARVGIGGRAADLRALSRSYDEACAALTRGSEVIAVYRRPAAPREDLAALSARVCADLSARRVSEARSGFETLCARAAQRFGAVSGLRQFLCSTLYAMCFHARQLGAAGDSLDRILWKADDDMHGVSSPHELRALATRGASAIIDEIRQLYSTRRDKLVERACRTVEQLIEQRSPRIVSSTLAAECGVSASHFGRTFRASMGMTFERYVMKRRIEAAKRLLLNPGYNVSQTAEQCGFADPAYFARVFRQLVRCSPRQYIQEPLRYDPPAF